MGSNGVWYIKYNWCRYISEAVSSNKIGIFVTIGYVAKQEAGPGIVLSFLFAGYLYPLYYIVN